jgi:hypothetical protein
MAAAAPVLGSSTVTALLTLPLLWPPVTNVRPSGSKVMLDPEEDADRAVVMLGWIRRPFTLFTAAKQKEVLSTVQTSETASDREPKAYLLMSSPS